MTASGAENLTPRQAAKRLNVSYSTIKKYLRNGDLVSFKTPSGHHRIPIEQIQLFEQRKGPAVQDDAKTDSDTDHAAEESSSEGIYILLAEDTTDSQGFLSLYLESQGYEVRVAENGRKALQAIKEFGKPDIILTDLRMPEMDGFELIKEVKGKPHLKDIPIIGLSAFIDGDERGIGNDELRYGARALDAGADTILGKPFEMSHLHEKIKQLLNI